MEQTKKTEAVKVEATPVVTQQRATRANRIPVSGPRDILTIQNRDPNYSYRWVKDTPGRIQRFFTGGWEYHVDPDAVVGQRAVDSGSRLGSALTRNTDGTVLVAMRIPKEWYDEDQKRKWDEIDALESSMKADGGNLMGMNSAERPDHSKFSVGRK
jgi:hypothetical protein